MFENAQKVVFGRSWGAHSVPLRQSGVGGLVLFVGARLDFSAGPDTVLGHSLARLPLSVERRAFDVPFVLALIVHPHACGTRLARSFLHLLSFIANRAINIRANFVALVPDALLRLAFVLLGGKFTARDFFLPLAPFWAVLLTVQHADKVVLHSCRLRARVAVGLCFALSGVGAAVAVVFAILRALAHAVGVVRHGARSLHTGVVDAVLQGGALVTARRGLLRTHTHVVG